MAMNNKITAEQSIRLVIWPFLSIIFINTFGMLWYVLSGLADSFEMGSNMVISPAIMFRVALLAVSFVVGFFIFDQYKKKVKNEKNEKGEYVIRGKGVRGLLMHILVGLIETAFAFFTLNTFWLISNFSMDAMFIGMNYTYWLGFGLILLMSAYILTWQVAMGVLAYKQKNK